MEQNSTVRAAVYAADWCDRSRLVYETLRALVLLIVRVHAIRLAVRGVENVPRVGAGIIMSNHQSNLDPLLLGAHLPRPISIPGKAELFEIPVLRWVVRQLGSYPVDRESADASSLRRSLKVLRAGKLIAVFPEGTRTRTGAVGNFSVTLTKLALREDVPIVPTAVIGSGQILPPGNPLPRLNASTAVIYGELVHFRPAKRRRPTEAEVTHVTEMVRSRVMDLVEAGKHLIEIDQP